jgi:hypothetical protein
LASGFYAGLLKKLFRGNGYFFNNHACQASDVLSAIFPHVAAGKDDLAIPGRKFKSAGKRNIDMLKNDKFVFTISNSK